MDLDIATVADRPVDRAPLDGHWPPFMTNDPTSGLYYGYVDEHFPEFCLVALDRATGRPVAKAYSVPLSFAGDIAAGLPDGGWDWAIRQSAHDRLSGAQPTIASALEILVHPELRGGGLSGVMLAAMRDNARRLGFADLVAPVRPSGKHLEPHRPIDEYAFATRPDGLPVDPWLRVHVRAGGRIVNVAHHSMVVPARPERWREWTGLPFDTTGPVEVPFALSPVHCDIDQDVAVYVEPNVWVHHRTGA
ncbi:N-acetyltransferase [Spirilliplanes yamanashiensis]|uniref:N-acetyltransferase n=1 Tax=Spirilliplanes yamanashiensis TaxID=42233 RepID=UPI00194E7A25|nr:N-acetyltransferase [Spirilliplanes yamanashiensis]MDP9819608.1 GNAT superfamily N-acetyltransferase [Spirilliplanes yamanashiensis]